MANDSVDEINVGVALSTALLLPGDLDRNAELSEYEDYAVMLQRSVQAEAAIKAQNDAEEKAESVEAIKKEAAGAKSPTQNEQVLDLTQDEEDEEVSKDAILEKASSDVPPANKSIDETLQEIDAELAAEKVAEMSSQQSFEVQTQPAAEDS
ncbi:hypothetical protein HYC85_029175 [Camellia sinensis]|uniref:Uncharacterized protein n=1 Tax=Camellia sinensis TaxID=4442 RepID=A0A7J7G170_CAMSI|nr:hypothetical protein HYC85_029175 [Camellia sinensis]